MPDPEKLFAVAREWVAKAENDLKTAAHALTIRKGRPNDNEMNFRRS